MSDTVTDLDELFLIGTFLRRPPPELQIVPLEKDAILRAMPRCQTPPAARRRSGAGHRAAMPDPGDPSLF